MRLRAPMIPAFVNPAAGNADEVDAALRKAACFDIRPVAPDEVTQAVRAAMVAGADRVAAVGGDGTLSAAAAALRGSETALVMIPAGTFNHFARDHGIPTDLDAACAVARSPHTEHVDLALVNGRVFLNTSSVGVYANFVRVRERLESRFGYWPSSLMALVRTFVRVRPFQVWIETNAMQRTYETPLVFIGVGERELKLPKLGGRIDSGRRGLHVMVVRGRTRARLVALSLDAAARGVRALSRTPHLDTFLLSSCKIDQRHSTVAVDGEVVTMASPLVYEIAARALKVVLP